VLQEIEAFFLGVPRARRGEERVGCFVSIFFCLVPKDETKKGFSLHPLTQAQFAVKSTYKFFLKSKILAYIYQTKKSNLC
jgi:hypothetical protein